MGPRDYSVSTVPKKTVVFFQTGDTGLTWIVPANPDRVLLLFHARDSAFNLVPEVLLVSNRDDLVAASGDIYGMHLPSMLTADFPSLRIDYGTYGPLCQCSWRVIGTDETDVLYYWEVVYNPSTGKKWCKK